MEVKEVKNVFNFNAWSLKGQLVNIGRCPKCTLKLPCKHYKDFEDVKSDPSCVANTRKKSISAFNGQNNVSNRSGFVTSSETTKDFSSVQRYLDSNRSKEISQNRRRQIEIKSNNDDINDPALDDQSDLENRSIFSQNLKFHNKTPMKQRANRKLGR
jgi:hypothetical protein